MFCTDVIPGIPSCGKNIQSGEFYISRHSDTGTSLPEYKELTWTIKPTNMNIHVLMEVVEVVFQ